MVALVAASCGGGGAPTQKVRPVAKPGANVEAPAQGDEPDPFVAGGYVLVSREHAWVAGPPEGDAEPDFVRYDDEELLAAVVALPGRDGDEVEPPWPANSTCGGATPERWPSRRSLSVRDGAPRAGDIVVIVKEDVPLQRAMSFGAFAGQPVVYVVEKSDGELQMLSMRACAEQDPPEWVSRGVDVVVVDGVAAGVYMGSTGGFAGGYEGLDQQPRDSSADGLGRAIPESVFGERPAVVRLWFGDKVLVGEAELFLEAARAAEPGVIAMIGERRALWQLWVEIEALKVSGGVEKQEMKDALKSREIGIDDCAERAAFVVPDLASIAVSVTYAGGQPQVTLDPAVDEAATACFTKVLGEYVPRRKGGMTFTMALHRKSTDS